MNSSTNRPQINTREAIIKQHIGKHKNCFTRKKRKKEEKNVDF